MTYHGHLESGRVVLDQPIGLPDGTEVSVEPVNRPPAPPSAEHNDLRRDGKGEHTIGQQPALPTTRTPLGRRLRELREQFLAGGSPLLTWEQIDGIIRDRRGERDAEDAS